MTLNSIHDWHECSSRSSCSVTYSPGLDQQLALDYLSVVTHGHFHWSLGITPCAWCRQMYMYGCEFTRLYEWHSLLFIMRSLRVNAQTLEVHTSVPWWTTEKRWEAQSTVESSSHHRSRHVFHQLVPCSHLPTQEGCQELLSPIHLPHQSFCQIC